MSGGYLTDDHHDLYRLRDWASRLERDNPLLAEQMKDLYELLHRYDYYLSGDIGKDAIEKAWTTYRDKWMNIDAEKVEQVMFEKCLDLVDSMIKGYTNQETWY